MSLFFELLSQFIAYIIFYGIAYLLGLDLD